ncbi:hypothetical protein SORBI_3007G050750 [Sorghum bicolor]|uniref:Uncharacterized protein n=1 Tax=Sorghum bicolor TaxID=4558 RepID=A0A1Z5R935_SORBI|nr:hypothetical protein SORBI_3007G050750 [Sorghum bicolor]
MLAHTNTRQAATTQPHPHPTRTPTPIFSCRAAPPASHTNQPRAHTGTPYSRGRRERKPAGRRRAAPPESVATAAPRTMPSCRRAALPAHTSASVHVFSRCRVFFLLTAAFLLYCSMRKLNPGRGPSVPASQQWLGDSTYT